MLFQASVAALAFAVAVNAQGAAYQQCGGTGWQGATTCVSGYVCTVSSQYYSQCLPGTASSPVIQPATSTGSGGSTPISTGPAGSGPGTTLTSGYYWIRAVAAPNFHKYLQTMPVYTTGTAIMADYTTAGQFNIVDGQLVELISGGLLYANVAQPTTTDQRTIAVTFEKTKNTFGAFAFNGDAVTWSVSSINRPNLAAWYVCANQALFINLGAYAYNGPSGCADQTIHYYNGATAMN